MDDFALGMIFGVGCLLYYLHYESFEFLRTSIAALIYLAFVVWQLRMMPNVIKNHKNNQEYVYMLICIFWSLLLIFATVYIFFFTKW